ncbi:transglutaminase domain-containing protein [Patescibacteria group bacterium]|nr:transglutaminase domain-containing protein [Patescibacteria group bacterium]
MQKLKLLVFTIYCLAFFASTQSIATVIAQDTTQDFNNTIESVYTVGSDGVTQVSHHIKIINNTPTVYLKQYALKTSYSGLSNIAVKDRNGNKIPSNQTNDGLGTSIGITFEDQAVGQGKSRDFYIEYQNHDLATIAGRVLEVHIPKLGDSNSFYTNKTTLITPAYFSLPVRITPEPKTTDFKQTNVISTFDRPSGESISAIYGQEQVYKMTLRYSLENPTNSPALTQISLPPDTPFQKMHYHALDPLPNEMKKDLDGNWIATYRIPANTAIVIHLTAEAKVTLDPNLNIPFSNPTKGHIKNLKYWESDDPFIIDKTQAYTTPREIYDFVVQSLEYSREELTLKNISRLGAIEAFNHPYSAVCQEFTDAFITIARANKIPARRLIGYAYTENSVLRPLSFEGDILHSWPEYYSFEKNLWIQIDPTWGDTTGGIDYFKQFDLNHIVFSINGISSSLPYPAGAYKIKSEDTKDVEVSIGEKFPNISPQISTRMVQKKFFFIPIPGMYEMQIINDTGQAWYDIETNVTSVNSEVGVVFNKKPRIETLLPFQTLNFDVTFFTENISIPKDESININYLDLKTNTLLYESSTQTIKAGPKIIKQIQNTQTIIYLGIGIVVIALVTGSVLVLRQRRESALRRQSQEAQKQTQILH